ncbi:hypothetical protein ABZ953_28590 [Streptomyces sp. NPDC046465]|uniref:hypothetical protein n=1 Tax=Streptomyces sp. NPDC046465 TaxID=3155810 RepID=UPI0033F8D60C
MRGARADSRTQDLRPGKLHRVAEGFGVDTEYFSGADEDRLATDLRTALADEARGGPLPDADDLSRPAGGARHRPAPRRAARRGGNRLTVTPDRRAFVPCPVEGRDRSSPTPDQ